MIKHKHITDLFYSSLWMHYKMTDNSIIVMKLWDKLQPQMINIRDLIRGFISD